MSGDCEKVLHRWRCYWPWLIIAVVIFFTSSIRIRLLEVPLERDEGEYAYAGQLILQGVPPYAEVYNMKMPGVYAAYALILAIFGQTQSGIHSGLLVINGITILLVFALGRKLYGAFAGVAAAASFGLLSLGQSVQGVFANAEHFVIPFALGGILLLMRGVDYQKWAFILGGAVLFGVGFLMKQHGAIFIVFGGMYLFLCELSRRRFAWKSFVGRSVLFLADAALPFGVTCLILWWLGVFEKFWFWTFDYAREYASVLPLEAGIYFLKLNVPRVVGSAVLLWVLAGVGLSSLWWNRQAHRHRLFVIGFFVFSFLAMCPSFYFRPHYFILSLPAVSLLAGIGAGSIRDIFSRFRWMPARGAIPILLAVVVVVHSCYQQRDFFFTMSPARASYKTYQGHPFCESVEVARFIKEQTVKDDRIAVLGSEPQIFFYADRRSATGYIYTYPLMEPHPYALKMQQEMIGEIERARPKFLVVAIADVSWVVGIDSELMIFEWADKYAQKYYHLVGVIDMIKAGRTVYRWGKAAVDYLPKSKSYLCVYRRNS